jgi:hypothetical protein
MNTPSTKNLAAIFSDPITAKSILKMTRAQLIEHPAGRARVEECMHSPRTYDIRLSVLNDIGGFHGVESIESSRGERADYLNSGDSYTPTLIYWRGSYRVQDVGTLIERAGVSFK